MSNVRDHEAAVAPDSEKHGQVEFPRSFSLSADSADQPSARVDDHDMTRGPVQHIQVAARVEACGERVLEEGPLGRVDAPHAVDLLEIGGERPILCGGVARGRQRRAQPDRDQAAAPCQVRESGRDRMMNDAIRAHRRGSSWILWIPHCWSASSLRG